MQLSKWIRGQDAYGKRVSLNLKGEESFKSAFGGLVTLAGRLVLLYYVIISLISLSNHEYRFQRYGWSNDVITKPNTIKITRANFQVAMRLSLFTYDPVLLKKDLNQHFRLDF